MLFRSAVTAAPERESVPHAVVRSAEIKTPAPFKELDNPEVKTFITSLQELMVEVETAKYKSSGIDLSKISNPRERALAMEQKELSESIDKNAYVVNDQAGVLSLMILILHWSLMRHLICLISLQKGLLQVLS